MADLAASLQAAISDALTEKLMLAAAHTKHRTIVLAGGVSANSGLRARVEAACRERGYTIFLPPLALCGDNAAMVGAQGFYEWRAGHTADARRWTLRSRSRRRGARKRDRRRAAGAGPAAAGDESGRGSRSGMA